MSRRIQSIRHDLRSFFFIIPSLPKIMIAFYACQHMSVFLHHYYYYYYYPPHTPAPLKIFSNPLDLDLDLDPSSNSPRHTMIIRRSASMMMVVLHLIIPLFMQIIFFFFLFFFTPLSVPHRNETYFLSIPSSFVIILQLPVSFSRFISVLDLA